MTLPAPSPITALAIQFGMPESNRHGFQAAVERLLGSGTAKKAAKVKPGWRIAWRSYGPMRRGGCGQCGDGADCADHWTGSLGGHQALCDRCYAVLERSRAHWVPNDDYPSAG